MENGDLNTPRDLDAELIKLVKENQKYTRTPIILENKV